MRGILINPWTKEITEVQLKSELSEFYRLLTNPLGPKVELMDTAFAWRNGDVLWVDDEGLLKPRNRCFKINVRTDRQPLAGNGLIVGCTREGANQDAQTMLTDLQTQVEWTNLITVGVE